MNVRRWIGALLLMGGLLACVGAYGQQNKDKEYIESFSLIVLRIVFNCLKYLDRSETDIASNDSE